MASIRKPAFSCRESPPHPTPPLHPVMTLRFWRDASLQLASASPALPHTAIHIIR